MTITRGRGAARVSLVVSFAELDRWARRQQIEVPRLMKRSFGRACAGLKQKFRQVIANAGGVCGVPKFKDFEEFTKELRVVGHFTDKPMGGALADKRRIVAFKRNGWQVIGWPDALAEWSLKFQDGEGANGYDPFTDPKRRANWHSLGITDVPRAYVHNPRRVLPEPFGSFVKAHLDEWATGAFYKELAKQMQKGATA